MNDNVKFFWCGGYGNNIYALFVKIIIAYVKLTNYFFDEKLIH